MLSSACTDQPLWIVTPFRSEFLSFSVDVTSPTPLPWIRSVSSLRYACRHPIEFLRQSRGHSTLPCIVRCVVVRPLFGSLRAITDVDNTVHNIYHARVVHNGCDVELLYPTTCLRPCRFMSIFIQRPRGNTGRTRTSLLGLPNRIKDVPPTLSAHAAAVTGYVTNTACFVMNLLREREPDRERASSTATPSLSERMTRGRTKETQKEGQPTAPHQGHPDAPASQHHPHANYSAYDSAEALQYATIAHSVGMREGLLAVEIIAKN
ncbi:hypothetical protein BJV78DRAFT_912743 [Lactifluus subvellereus]|nr:hypothetical protein BJV78DRAFT_912743 [Lactifluus subvellereus]